MLPLVFRLLSIPEEMRIEIAVNETGLLSCLHMQVMEPTKVWWKGRAQNLTIGLTYTSRLGCSIRYWSLPIKKEANIY